MPTDMYLKQISLLSGRLISQGANASPTHLKLFSGHPQHTAVPLTCTRSRSPLFRAPFLANVLSYNGQVSLWPASSFPPKTWGAFLKGLRLQQIYLKLFSGHPCRTTGVYLMQVSLIPAPLSRERDIPQRAGFFVAGRPDAYRNHARCAGSPAAEGSKAIVVDIRKHHRVRG